MSAVRRLAAVPDDEAGYQELERHIQHCDETAILVRWQFGRALLAERQAHGGKQLPAGRLEVVARAVGRSTRELQHRIRFSELFGSETEARNAFRSFGSWHAIVEALSGTPRRVQFRSSDEWVSPCDVVESARAVMGGIDLDPASSVEANRLIRADRWFSIDADGLAQPWRGRLFLNPPFSHPGVELFCAKLVEHRRAGDVEQACVILPNSTETVFFQSLAVAAAAFCFPRGRLRFTSPSRVSTSSAPQGHSIVYLGAHVAAFRREFDRYGLTVVR